MTPATDNYTQMQHQRSISCRGYKVTMRLARLAIPPTALALMWSKIRLGLGFDLVPSPQHLASSDVREGLFGVVLDWNPASDSEAGGCILEGEGTEWNVPESVVLRFLERDASLRRKRYFQSAAEPTQQAGVTYNLGRNPLSWTRSGMDVDFSLF